MRRPKTILKEILKNEKELNRYSAKRIIKALDEIEEEGILIVSSSLLCLIYEDFKKLEEVEENENA